MLIGDFEPIWTCEPMVINPEVMEVMEFAQQQ